MAKALALQLLTFIRRCRKAKVNISHRKPGNWIFHGDVDNDYKMGSSGLQIKTVAFKRTQNQIPWSSSLHSLFPSERLLFQSREA